MFITPSRFTLSTRSQEWRSPSRKGCISEMPRSRRRCRAPRPRERRPPPDRVGHVGHHSVVRGIGVHAHHVRALGPEARDGGRADAGGRAGHERAPSLESSHGATTIPRPAAMGEARSRLIPRTRRSRDVRAGSRWKRWRSVPNPQPPSEKGQTRPCRSRRGGPACCGRGSWDGVGARPEGLRAGSSPASLLGVRLLVAALVLSALCAPSRGPRVRPRELAIGAVAGVAFAAAGLGEFEALSRAPAPTVVLLVFVAPVWVAAASWATGRGPPGWPTAGALALILGGLALLVGVPGGNGLEPGAAGLALGASVMSALFFIVMADLAGGATAAGGMHCGMGGRARDARSRPEGIVLELSRPATAAYGISIGCLTACALALLATGLRAGSALWASAVIGVEPLVAAALSALLLGEFLSGAQLAGAAAVLAGVTAMSMLTGPGPPSPCATGRSRRRRPGSRRLPRPARTALPRRSADRWRARRG